MINDTCNLYKCVWANVGMSRARVGRLGIEKYQREPSPWEQ